MKTSSLFVVGVALGCIPVMAQTTEAEAAAPATSEVSTAAATPIAAEAAEEINKAVTTHAKPVSAKSLVRKDIEDYCKETGITIGASRQDGAIYLSGMAGVLAPVQSPNFTRSRAAAYMKAYQDAVAKYVMDKFGKNIADSERTYFSDQSSNRLQPSVDVKDAAARIAEKSEQLVEAELDERLRALGKTPAGSVSEKRRLLTDAIVKGSMSRAVGSAAGLLPVQTFEGWNESGKYAVGVVIRGGVETETLAECLRYKMRPAISRPSGLTVAEALPTDDELVSQFGVRIFFDEKGVPALLSFGQWGSAYTGTDEDEAERAMDHALRQAEAIANEQLTEFINSTISVQEESAKSEEMNQDVLFDENGVPSEEKLAEYIDRYASQSKIKAEDTMIGRSTVMKKVVTHPANGCQLAICVRMWSFDQYEAMKRIIEKPKPQAMQTPAPTVPTGPSGKRRGRSYDF